MLASFLSTDRALGAWLASRIAGPWLDHVMVWVSVIGARGTIWIAIGLVIAIAAPAKRMAVWRLLLSIALAGLITDGITKPLVGRIRPWVDHPEYREVAGTRPESSSFPSGHAATAAAGALALTRLWPPAAAPAAVLALLIGTSRIALGVHFPSDVLGGFVIGYLCARFVCTRPPREFRGPAGAAAETVTA